MAAEKRAAPVRRRATGVEALLREVLTLQAAHGARLEDLSSRLVTTQDDAREARDLGNRISTILEEQNIITRFGDHKTEVRQAISEIRADFVAANVRLRNDLEAHATSWAKDVEGIRARLKALEDEQQRREGAKSLAGWIMKNAPWLFAVIAALGAGLGLQDKIK